MTFMNGNFGVQKTDLEISVTSEAIPKRKFLKALDTIDN